MLLKTKLQVRGVTPSLFFMSNKIEIQCLNCKEPIVVEVSFLLNNDLICCMNCNKSLKLEQFKERYGKQNETSDGSWEFEL